LLGSLPGCLIWDYRKDIRVWDVAWYFWGENLLSLHKAWVPPPALKPKKKRKRKKGKTG
jgi:hypothetical protein